mmetsp:Transcript_41878/g.125354  ORF Transcript_41878/g.125354 Transcript_41878/m.125354 type:complete len:124 (-) Transcript_41878:931-1302(-)
MRLQAVCRVADTAQPPSLEALNEEWKDNDDVKKGKAHPLALHWACKHGFVPNDKTSSRSATPVPAQDHELKALPSLTLDQHLASLLDYITFVMRQTWGGRDAADCVVRMQRATMGISGGIERA